MTREQALTHIIKSKVVEKSAQRYATYIAPNQDDFVQHIYLILCELDEEKMVGLVERGEIEFYVLYICRAQATNPISTFHIQHNGRIQTEQLNENTNELDEDI